MLDDAWHQIDAFTFIFENSKKDIENSTSYLWVNLLFKGFRVWFSLWWQLLLFYLVALPHFKFNFIESSFSLLPFPFTNFPFTLNLNLMQLDYLLLFGRSTIIVNGSLGCFGCVCAPQLQQSSKIDDSISNHFLFYYIHVLSVVKWNILSILLNSPVSKIWRWGRVQFWHQSGLSAISANLEGLLLFTLIIIIIICL